MIPSSPCEWADVAYLRACALAMAHTRHCGKCVVALCDLGKALRDGVLSSMDAYEAQRRAVAK